MKKYCLYHLLWVLVLPSLAHASSYAPPADFSTVRQNAQCQLTTMHESFLKNWTPPANFFLVPFLFCFVFGICYVCVEGS